MTNKYTLKKQDINLGDLVYVVAGTDERLGFVTRFSNMDDDIFYLDELPAFISNIKYIVTKEWYDKEMSKINPFITWSHDNLKRLNKLMNVGVTLAV